MIVASMVEVFDASKKQEKKQEKTGEKKVNSKSMREIRKVIGVNGKEGLFTSFVTFPSEVEFETQHREEKVVLFLRQHPVVNLGWLGLLLFLVLLPGVFPFFPPYGSLPGRFQAVFVLVWYLLVLGFGLARFMGWFYNAFMMTDERLVDMDFSNIFYRVISDAKIDKVQDVHSKMSGVWQTLFNYGSVYIQTAGEKREFVFENVPEPDLVARYINQMIDLEEKEKLEGRVR